MTFTHRITPRECAAIRLLSSEWTVNELAMCFGYGEMAIIRHSNGECSCVIDDLDLEAVIHEHYYPDDSCVSR